jgi:phage terminase large subunit GpA-like protein
MNVIVSCGQCGELFPVSAETFRLNRFAPCPHCGEELAADLAWHRAHADDEYQQRPTEQRVTAECRHCPGEVEFEGGTWVHTRIDDGSHEAQPQRHTIVVER